LEGTRTRTDNVIIGETATNKNGVEVPFQYIAQSDTITEVIPMGVQKIEVPALSGDGTPKIKSLTKTSSGSANNYSRSNPGGKKSGGSSKTKVDKVEKKDVVDRYKEVTDALDDNADAMGKAARAADRLYGADRLKKMQKANDLL